MNGLRQSRFGCLIFLTQELNERRSSSDVHHAAFVQHTEYETIITASLRDWHWLTAGPGQVCTNNNLVYMTRA